MRREYWRPQFSSFPIFLKLSPQHFDSREDSKYLEGFRETVLLKSYSNSRHWKDVNSSKGNTRAEAPYQGIRQESRATTPRKAISIPRIGSPCLITNCK